MASAYGSTSRAPRSQASPRQAGPARAIPISSSSTIGSPRVYNTLNDIDDWTLRMKVKEIHGIYSNYTITQCMEALVKNKGNINDSLAWLAEQEEVAQSVSQSYSQSSQPVRPLAKQTVKAPSKTIAEKYRRQSAAQDKFDSESDSDEDIRPRKGRITQRNKTAVVSSPPSSPPLPENPLQRRQRIGKNKRTVITIDDDDVDDAGKDGDSGDLQAGVEEIRAQRLLKLINEATVHDLAELSGQQEEPIQFVLDRRPFNDLDEVRAVVQETLTKTGKKSKKTRNLGEKLVEDCTEVMTGYDAIDELVVECEKIAQPVQEALRGWGVGDADGELQVMNLDEVHDSGIGTPSSSVAPEDNPNDAKAIQNKPKGGFIGQPSNMNQELKMKDYQLVGLNWLNLLYKGQLSCILADDMGLGKTCQIIGFLSYLQSKKVDGVHLIIVPGSTLENWLREFERFAPNMNVQAYYGLQAERASIQYDIEQNWDKLDVIVTTYDMAIPKDDNKFLRRMGPFAVCVYDEAHALRNPKSLRYQQLVRIGADFKVLLTGTPLQNNLQELVAILAFIMPRLFEEKREDLEYIFKHKASTKDTASAALLSNERIVRARTMMTPFILRRKKAQVLDLPAKHCRVEHCDMTDSQANYYADLLEDAQQFYEQKATGAAKGTARESSNVIMSLRKAAIHPLLARRIYDDKKLDKMVIALAKSDEFGGNPPGKIRSYIDGTGTGGQVVKGGDFGLHKFCYERESMRKKFALKKREWMDAGKVKKFEELVTKFAKNGDRVLVFSQFTTLMDILEAVLEELKIKFMRLDGSTKMNERQDMIDQFYEDETITVFMLSTKAGGAGINLAAANKVIIFDSGFNPQDDIQAENRAHRVGQTREVEVVRLVTRGTIEEQIHALGESKLALDERVAGEGASAAESKEAEKAGEQMVEQILANNLTKKEAKVEAEETKPSAASADLKDAFKTGMEAKGVKVASRQAQF
ncbi:hypothetical protein DOTSEDRAFT_130915 [Dothistroma septosporum NZE10]|uniref:DNA helicase n=1 Tax=Dothistroma septosporum (strain NZE10 / CBS 128990) TaxID=675120 RepID=N1PNI9_DOTSN|nr:hypothetical protein DOTSEDRAFT_130915 [Dothistroma septosporum NZE10]